MNSDTLLGIAAIGAVGIGGLIALRMLDPSRQPVANPVAQPVVPPSYQPALPPSSQPATGYPVPTYPSPTPVAPTPYPQYPTPTPTPTPAPPTPTPPPTITKGQLCADLKAQLQKVQSLAEDTQKKMNDLVAKGSSADKNCWSYAKREACGIFDICSPALWGNYDACMRYVKGEGARPGNLFNYDDSRAVDQAHQEYAKLKSELETYQAQIDGLKKQLQQLALEGVVC
ncbi:VP20 [Thermus phage P23-77]|uniref:VP20 n=1 Tax=Thermus virus P23-77 TaxID=1714272 RepID=C8CHL8_9VIRU|nr:virion structural protein [Thermus phage P23-77]ACV05047.1 VP20 [Thermus phage P23-77]